MSAPLIGIMSCGQADIATMQSISARRTTRSPGFATVGSQSMPPSAPTGMFIQTLKGCGTSRRPRADRGHRHPQVVRAVVVVVGAAEPEVAEEVAGRDQRVVDAGRGVLDQRQDRAAAVGEQRVADPRHDPPDAGARMLPREVLGRVRGAEGPEVADLGAVGVDDGDRLARLEPHRPALARRHGVDASGLGPAVGRDRARRGGVLAEGRARCRRGGRRCRRESRRVLPGFGFASLDRGSGGFEAAFRRRDGRL